MTASPDTLVDTLESEGIVALPPMLDPAALAGLQEAFERVLAQPAFNTWYGYEQNEKWRLLVENALTVDPAVVDLALNPLLKTVLHRYLGPSYALTEARGWRTIRTTADFHGWHNDAWCDESVVDLKARPREVKLALSLTDVESGHFSYIAGTHRHNGPSRHWSPAEVEPMLGRRRDMLGKAGSAFLFDTAGVHRQTSPVLKPRNVLFLNFHDPAVRIQPLDVEQGRYRPLLLNAAFLPEMGDDDRRILGFGVRKGRPVRDCVVGLPNRRRYPVLHDGVKLALSARLELQELQRQVRRVSGGIGRRLRRLVGADTPPPAAGLPLDAAPAPRS
jgi:hypothetical protein